MRAGERVMQPDEPVIEVTSLGKDFPGRKVLDDLTFSVDKGEVFGFLGPNGAGKTTTMRILLGLLLPTTGTATVLGADLSIDDKARKRVGVLMENNGLYDRLTARENLSFFMRLNECQTLRHANFRDCLYAYRIHGASLSARAIARPTGPSTLPSSRSM